MLGDLNDCEQRLDVALKVEQVASDDYVELAVCDGSKMLRVAPVELLY
jgi:hypothetical protein